MERYSEERKQTVLIKMMAPENKGAMELSEETGIPYQALCSWRKQAKEKGCAVPGSNQNPEKWPSSDKFATVLETASLNEAEFGEYCRKKACTQSKYRNGSKLVEMLKQNQSGCPLNFPLNFQVLGRPAFLPRLLF